MVGVMAKRDARSLDHATLEEMRRLAVKRVVGGGETQVAARSLEVHPVTEVSVGLSPPRRCRAAPHRPVQPTLTPVTAQLRRCIIDRTPQQVRFPVALWTLPLIAQLIEQRFGVVLHKTTVARLLARLGLSPQRPVRRAFTRDDEACRRWAETEFPAVVRQMKRRQSTLLFEDETGVHEDGPVARTWGARGQTPVVRVTGQRDRVNVLSAISPRGRLWFRCYRGTLNAPRFVGFLTALLHDVRGEIDLVLDRHPAHVAAATRRFVHAHRARLRLHFLPGYAPDLNPDEHVWTQLKALFRRQPLARDEDLGSAVNAAMTMIQEDRRLVRKFFGHPAVAYVKKALPW
jgi:transposase